MDLIPFQYLGLAALVVTVYLALRVRWKHAGRNDNAPIDNKGGDDSSPASKSIWHANKEQGEEDVLRDPKPLLDFDLKTAKTRDYIYVNKTLRYPYYQTMAHQPMEIENWIEITSDYEWYLSEKKKVIESEPVYQGKKVLDSLPENDFACQELMETVIDWLPKRYPTLFDRLLRAQDEGSYDGIFNRVTGERFEWLEGHAPDGCKALTIISRLTECDFLMAREREDGHVYFTGGLVAFPGFYLLSEKIDKPMAVVHAPVPQFNEKLLMSVERTLKRMLPSAPFERSSWEIVDDLNLYWHNIALLPAGGKVSVDPGDLYLRIDRQTFRKLPKSRGIIFGVHPLVRKLESLRRSPLLPALLHKIHTESSRDLMVYKGAEAYEAALGPWLEEAMREQVESGLIGGTENVGDFREYAGQERDE
ncbi:hypothetical protein CALVIDRAFT_595249 [Calocera viscosa TUFC12733]|uniref:HRQ family protein n=1 Tax=Calocera viscosa (strain TUFC12733) TaxID=1330018 RepID=A0A167R0J2_CALVF|nr:hypothetical protein CALVIDRAFT_595249 [Calocera viscosa TUFC12733]